MVYIIVATSVHHAIDLFGREQETKCKDTVYAIPGLSLDPYANSLRKNVQNLLSKDQKDKTETFFGTMI